MKTAVRKITVYYNSDATHSAVVWRTAQPGAFSECRRYDGITPATCRRLTDICYNDDVTVNVRFSAACSPIVFIRPIEHSFRPPTEQEFNS